MLVIIINLKEVIVNCCLICKVIKNDVIMKERIEEVLKIVLYVLIFFNM